MAPRTRCRREVPGDPVEDDPRVSPRKLAAFLAGQYADAGWSRTEHYAWIAELVLELGITSLSELATVLRRGLDPIPAVRADHLEAPSRQPASQRVAVISFVQDQTLRMRRGLGVFGPDHVDLVEGPLQKLDLRRAGRVAVTCQRSSFTIDHHHPLGSLALLGVADPVTPFFAGAKLPSAKHSSQRRRPSALS